MAGELPDRSSLQLHFHRVSRTLHVKQVHGDSQTRAGREVG